MKVENMIGSGASIIFLQVNNVKLVKIWGVWKYDDTLFDQDILYLDK